MRSEALQAIYDDAWDDLFVAHRAGFDEEGFMKYDMPVSELEKEAHVAGLWAVYEQGRRELDQSDETRPEK